MAEAGKNMNELDEWEEIDCFTSNGIRSGLKPVSSLTDLEGEFGRPVVYTEWASPDDDSKPVLRDYRWPGGPDSRCKHYIPKEATNGQ